MSSITHLCSLILATVISIAAVVVLVRLYIKTKASVYLWLAFALILYPRLIEISQESAHDAIKERLESGLGPPWGNVSYSDYIMYNYSLISLVGTVVMAVCLWKVVVQMKPKSNIIVSEEPTPPSNPTQ